MSRVVHPEHTRTEMTWIVMPGHCNALGTAFGGQIMAWIDVCAAISAQRFTQGAVVTASMDSLVFEAPVQQGDVVVLQSMVNWAGRTSMEVGVLVEVEDTSTGTRRSTARAYLTFVHLNEQGQPQPVGELRPRTDEDRRRFAGADERRAQRLALRRKLRDRRAR
jgi:acyl-CoA hydrolase